MNKFFTIIFLAIGLLGNTNKVTNVSIAPETINWVTFEQAVAQNKKKPKKIFIDVYTHWCGWCKHMDKNTFSNPELAKYINQNYYAVKLNAEQREPITYNGKVYNYVPQYKSHEIALSLLNGQMSYPTTVYLDENLSILTTVAGYIDVYKFERIIKFYGENHYLKTKWADFEQNYKSTLK